MFDSAGVPVRPFGYLDMPILIIAHVPCIHAHDVHTHHDITRFGYDANRCHQHSCPIHATLK